MGTWLSACREKKIEDVLGLDGPWVPKDLLVIPEERFLALDFNAGLVPQVERRYGLAICLEVAEHINQDKADHFVDFLTALSDQILFSAAIPGQGGNGHVNEQWPAYWIERFRKKGYAACDTIRPAIWSDPRIPWWYRQNTILFVSSEVNRSDTAAAGKHATFSGLPIVHPETFQARTQLYTGQAMQLLFHAIRAALKRRFQRA